MTIAFSLVCGFAIVTCSQSPRLTVSAKGCSAEQVKAFVRYAGNSEKLITRFFGIGFQKPVDLSLCKDRATFDEHLKRQWGMEKTERWMVGAAGASKAFFLSPDAWAKEADEHNANDAVEVERIVAHELTHSYHAQNNPSKDLDGMDDMAWFAEGLATYVSGQLDKARLKLLPKPGEPGFPSSLATIWKGRARYGLAGSLVKYIDGRWGRKGLSRLLIATTNETALKTLGVSENELMDGWKSWLAHR